MPTGISDKTTGQQLTAAEFNIVKNLVDTNETNAAQAIANAAAAQGDATQALADAAAAQGDATQALADAASALSRANHTGTQTASTISNFDTAVGAATAVAANTAKVGVPATTGTAGFLANTNPSGHTLSYVASVNEWLASPADDGLITALGSASWVSNQATVAGWAASRKHIDSSYLYVANADDTVYRFALGSGTDAVSLQGRNVAATAPTDGQSLVWNNGASQWEPQTVSGGGGGSEFSEAVFRINNNVDATKQIRFDGSAIATATLRTITMPNADVDLANVRTDAEVVEAIDSELGGTGWQSGGSGSTDLSYTAGTRLLESSSGADVTLPLADGSNPGLMSSANFTKLENTVEVDGTGLSAGEIVFYDGTEFVVDTSETADAATTINLGYVGSVYTGCVASSYTIASADTRKSAVALITNATEPTFTLAGGTVTKVGWGSNWDASNQNHVTFVAVSATLVYAYLSGAEA